MHGSFDERLSWHPVTKAVAGIAQRSGFSIRPNPGGWNFWEVWATDPQIRAIELQGEQQ